MELIKSFRDAFNWNHEVDSRKDVDENSRKDISMNDRYLLYLLGSLQGSAFSGAVKLVKAIFLTQSEASKKATASNFSYNFYRWDYGPFDSAIYRDIETLKARGLVSVQLSSSPYPEKVYTLTVEGQNTLKKFEADIPTNFKEIASKWANKVNTMKREEVLKFVYDKSNVKAYEMGDSITLPDIE